MLTLEEPEGVRVLRLLEQNFFLVETPRGSRPGELVFRLWAGWPFPLQTPCVDLEFDQKLLNRGDESLAPRTLEAIRTAKILLGRARLLKWSARRRIAVSSRGVRLRGSQTNAGSSGAARRPVVHCS